MFKINKTVICIALTLGITGCMSTKTVTAEEQLYVVFWEDLKSGNHGSGQPITFKHAKAAVELANNEYYTQLVHWYEEYQPAH